MRDPALIIDTHEDAQVIAAALYLLNAQTRDLIAQNTKNAEGSRLQDTLERVKRLYAAIKEVEANTAAPKPTGKLDTTTPAWEVAHAGRYYRLVNHDLGLALSGWHTREKAENSRLTFAYPDLPSWMAEYADRYAKMWPHGR